MTFDRIVLLNDWAALKGRDYLAWLEKRVDIPVEIRKVKLKSPMDFAGIYKTALAVATEVKGENLDVELVFHLSPGTSAMAAVWVLLAKARLPARLIQSSVEAGVEEAEVPFDIEADFLPDLYRKADGDLAALGAGLAPVAPEFTAIVHTGDAMKRVLAKAKLAAPRSVPVLIEGESGTGKELLAQAIHRASPRHAKPIRVVNCGALPENLIESTLFGHKKGAFTGASKDEPGLFESAQGGTLFLDEVGELPLSSQVKLLRALGSGGELGRITRVGDTEEISVDVRIIAATNRSLATEVQEGRFREDLFYRLAVAVIRTPSLRERNGDLEALIDHFLNALNDRFGSDVGYEHKKLSIGAKKVLLQHTWPGNIRELQNTLTRAAIWTTGSTIGDEDVRDALLPSTKLTADRVLDRELGNGFDLDALLNDVKRHYLERAMKESGNVKRKAAELVGLNNYQTFSNWLDKVRSE